MGGGNRQDAGLDWQNRALPFSELSDGAFPSCGCFRLMEASMTPELTIAAAPPATATPNEQFSAAWWEMRSAEELRDIIKRGFAGGDAFQGAVAEAERRAREATNRLRAEAAAVAAKRRRRLKMLAIGALVGIAVIALSMGAWSSL
jgi:hypothetical protein